jgi:hypothetical protein
MQPKPNDVNKNVCVNENVAWLPVAITDQRSLGVIV